MDYSKINELREYPFVKAFLAGKVTESTFHDDFNAFLKDPYFRSTFGFTEDNINLDELRTLENTLKFPQFTKVLKYNVILWRNLLLSSRLGCQVDILDFSTTRTGTHKYIKALAVLNLPRVQKAKRLFVVSAGNYAYSLIQAMKDLKMHKEVIVIIDRSTDYSVIRMLEHENAEFIIKDLNERMFYPRENILTYLFSKKKAVPSIQSNEEKMTEIFTENIDVTNFYMGLLVGHPSRLHASPPYWESWKGFILYKDVVQTLEEYDYIACPVGSGELIYAFWNEYKESPSILRQKIPVFIGVVPTYAHRLGAKGIIKFEDLQESKAQALVTAKFEMDLRGLRRDINWWSATDKDFIEANRLANYAGINSEISGSAGLVFMDVNIRNRNNIHLKSTDKILIVNTGNGKILP